MRFGPDGNFAGFPMRDLPAPPRLPTEHELRAQLRAKRRELAFERWCRRWWWMPGTSALALRAVGQMFAESMRDLLDDEEIEWPHGFVGDRRTARCQVCGLYARDEGVDLDTSSLPADHVRISDSLSQGGRS